MIIRELRESDLPRLLSFLNENLSFDPLTLELLREKTFGDPDFDPALTLVAEREGRIAAFMQGVARDFLGEKRGWIKLFATGREFRRQGLASELLSRVEADLWRRGVQRIQMLDSAPNYLQPGIDPRYTEAVVFAQRRGYERFDDTANLEVDLTSQDLDTSHEEKRLSEQGFLIRRAEPDHWTAIRDFLQKYWPAWIPEVRATFQNRPISLHVAFRGEQVVAFSAHEANNRGTGWFGPMGTNPDYRGRGIGAVLLKRCLRDLKEQGHPRATIPWVGPIDFYLRHVGARVSRIFWRFRKMRR